MKIKVITIKAFSLLEVLLAAVIFVISIAGIFYTITSIRNPVSNKENALSASIFGQQVLEALYSKGGSSSSATGANSFYDIACEAPNVDGSCGAFSLYMGPGAQGVIHEVSANTLQTATGLTWPSSISASNTCSSAGINSSCLYYTVNCSDGDNSLAPYCNPTAAKKVDLQINWPSVP